MIAEEIGLNEHLAANGIEPVETDLGEYIIQLRDEPPSHIIAPAVHVTRDQIEADFRRAHTKLAPQRDLSRADGAAGRGARDAAPTLPRRRRRHHRRQLPDRGDRNVGDRHQRGQRRPHPDAGAGAHRARHDREDHTDAGGREPDPAAAGALGDRPGHVGLHHLLHRPAPAGRPGRAAGIPRRHPRQRPLERHRDRVPGHPALHPLRRLHEPLPGLPGGRRPRLRLGLSGADGRGADADADRHRQGGQPSQRLQLLRPLRGGVPDEDPAARHDAPLARARIRAASVAEDLPVGAGRVGVLRHAAAALPAGDAARHARPRQPRCAQGPLPAAAARRRLDRHRDLPAPEGQTFQEMWAEGRRP